MNTARSFPSGRTRRPRRRASRRILPLVLVAFFVLVASAEAHNVATSTACSATGNSVTFTWTNFFTGTGNNGENQPTWTIVYTPTGQAPITYSGQVTFPGTTDTITVPIGGTAGTAVASSAWTSSQTTDYNAGSFSSNLTIPSCLGSPAIATTASGGVPAGGGPITDTAVLSGGVSPQGEITFSLYDATDTTCSTPLSTVTTAVSGDGTYTSPAVTENTAGTYQWTASYDGDINNNTAVEGCGSGASEEVTVPPVPPNNPPPPPPLTQPSIVTTASPAAAAGGCVINLAKPTPCKISDVAALSGGSSPTGTITFHLYAASDTTCSTALATSTAPVNGNGLYDATPVSESTGTGYQWTASYSGDAHNSAATEGCRSSAEQVPIRIVKDECLTAPKLTGVFGKVGNSVTAKVSALGIKSVTFYLDGKKLATVTKAHHGFFTIRINTKPLGFGQHKVKAKPVITNKICKPIMLEGSFIHHRSNIPPPPVTG